MGLGLAFTRDSFTPRLLCTNKSFFSPPTPPTLPTLLQYYCTTIAQYTTSPPTPLRYAIHHTILVMATSCKGKGSGRTESLVCTPHTPYNIGHGNIAYRQRLWKDVIFGGHALYTIQFWSWLSCKGKGTGRTESLVYTPHYTI